MMLSPGAETLLRMLGWTFLPDLGAQILLRVYRHALLVVPPIFNRKSIPPPYPNTLSDTTQRRYSLATVIFLYLVYTAIQGYLQAPPNFYQLLGVSADVDESTLKTAFRHFARHNHPDRAGASAEAAFIATRTAFDILKSPTTRVAYDKFGPDVIEWSRECQNLGDYLERGLMASVGFYLMSLVGMVLYAVFGRGGFGGFWRYNLLVTLACLELLLILSPPSSILASVFPSRVAYQHIRFLHQLFISTSIAITRIGPVLLPSFAGNTDPSGRPLSTYGEKDWEKERTALFEVVKQVSAIAARLDRDLSRMILGELKAAHGQIDTPAGISVDGGQTKGASANSTPSKAQKIAGGTSNSNAAAGLGGVELNDTIMRMLSGEVTDMVVEKNLKRHPLLGRIWMESLRREWERYSQNPRGRDEVDSSQGTTAVDLSQRLQQGEDWKKDYLQRRARSEELSPSRSQSPASSPLASKVFSTSQPSPSSHPPRATSRERIGSFVGGLSGSSLPRRFRDLSNAQRQDSAEWSDANETSGLNGMQPERRRVSGERSRALTAEGLASLKRLSAASGGLSYAPLGSPSPSRSPERFDSLGPVGVRSRSMSLVG